MRKMSETICKPQRIKIAQNRVPLLLTRYSYNHIDRVLDCTIKWINLIDCCPFTIASSFKLNLFIMTDRISFSMIDDDDVLLSWLDVVASKLSLRFRLPVSSTINSILFVFLFQLEALSNPWSLDDSALGLISSSLLLLPSVLLYSLPKKHYL